MMTMRGSVVAMVGAFALACGAADEGTGTTADDVTVTPHGSSTLGTFVLETPDAVKPGNGRALGIDLYPAPGQKNLAGVDTSELLASGSVRALPGTYCLRVVSLFQGARLTTRDCDVVLKGAATTSYRLSQISTTENQLQVIRAQHAVTGGVGAISVTGPHVEDGLFFPGSPSVLAGVKGTLTASIGATGASWVPVDTVVELGKDAVLGLPNEDRVVRFQVGSEAATLADAVPGGGMRWRWIGGPTTKDFDEWRNVPSGSEVRLFTGPTSKAVFEVGGIEQEHTLETPRTKGIRARRLEVTDVTETDETGHATTIAGSVSVKDKATGKPLAWSGTSGLVRVFPTNRGVLVWRGDYEVSVTYVANGVVKTYQETVRVP